MAGFTPVEGVIGGVLMALGMSSMLVLLGHYSGGSGVVAGLLWRADRVWRASFVVGMLAMSAVLMKLRPEMFPAVDTRPVWVMAIAGVVVGFGTRVGNGCTTGHAFGLARFSLRSAIAIATFFTTGVIAATVWRMCGGST